MKHTPRIGCPATRGIRLSARRRSRSEFRSRAPSRYPRRLPLAGHRRGALRLRPHGDLRAEPDQRVVLVPGHALLHRDDRVVGDLDVLGADLGAALGDVAVPEAKVVLSDVPPVGLVGRVHLELRDAREEPGAGEGLLVLRVVTDYVAGVLAQEALDALPELLRAVD